MSTKSTNPKVAYIYDSATDTWHPVAGLVSTDANYVWSGTNTFTNTVSFEDVLNAKAGVNNFVNPLERDTAIPTPTNGVVVFVRQDSTGNQINQLQYYYNGSWRYINDSTRLISESDNYQLELKDVGQTVVIDSATAKSVTIPRNSTTAFAIGQRLEVVRAGAGDVTIAKNAAVTLRSKNNYTKIANQYSGVVLIKTDTNTWLMIGDLKA